jgi:peptidase C39-like protein
MKNLPAMGRRLQPALATGLLLVLGGAWPIWRTGPAPPQPVHTSQSYGGLSYQSVDHPGAAGPVQDLLQPALDAYNAGRYWEAEAGAEQVVRQVAGSNDPAVRKQGARARWVLAFSAARRKDLRLARQRFSVLRQEASQLPDKGKPEAKPAENPPTLEEEGAYQHAVLTAALGDRKAAEAEFKAFMRSYPESPLVHAAVRRIARFHGGNIPRDAEAAWQQAMQTAQAREKERQVQRSLCGPEVLAEILRRAGKTGNEAMGKWGNDRPSISSFPHFPIASPPAQRLTLRLARELRTDERGTSLKALAEAARRRGFEPKGLALTYRGLLRTLQAPSPPRFLVALVQPGHFVLVERADAEEVRVWDPSAGGPGRPRARLYPRHEWTQVWNGIALALR